MGLVSDLADPVEDAVSRKPDVRVLGSRVGESLLMYCHDSREEKSQASRVGADEQVQRILRRM